MRTTYKDLYRRCDRIKRQRQTHGMPHPISVRGGGSVHGIDVMDDWHCYTVKKTLTPLLSNKACLAWLEGDQEALEHLVAHLSRETLASVMTQAVTAHAGDKA